MPGAIVYEKAVAEDLNIGVGEVDVTNPGGGKVRGTRINLGSFAFITYAAAWTPGSLGPCNTASPDNTALLAISLAGVEPGDFVAVSWDGNLSRRLALWGWVEERGTVNVVMANISSTGTTNPGTGNLRVLVFKTDVE